MVLDRYAGERILPTSHDLALVHAMLHTSSGRREECQVEPEKIPRERAREDRGSQKPVDDRLATSTKTAIGCPSGNLART